VADHPPNPSLPDAELPALPDIDATLDKTLLEFVRLSKEVRQALVDRLRLVRDALQYWEAFGAALPTPAPAQYGRLFVLQTNAADDKAYVCLRDSTGAYQWRQIYP
jgi:hypothetical protein